MGAQQSRENHPNIVTSSGLFAQKEFKVDLDESVIDQDAQEDSPFSSVHRKSQLTEYQKSNLQNHKSAFRPEHKKSEFSRTNVTQVRLSNQATSETKSSPSPSIVRSIDPEGCKNTVADQIPGNLGGSFTFPGTDFSARERRSSSRSQDRTKKTYLNYNSQPDMGRISQSSSGAAAQRAVCTEAEYLQLMKDVYQLLDTPAQCVNVSVQDIFTLAASKQQINMAPRHQTGQLPQSTTGSCVTVLKSKYAESQRMLSESQADQQSGRIALGALILSDCSLYSGEWLKGQMDGHGRQLYPDGSAYVGRWLAGKAHGQGCFSTPRGTYVGAFVAGKAHGKGVYVHNDQTKIEGEWVQDVLVGPAIESRPDGFLLEVSYYEGRKHGEAKGRLAPGVTFRVHFENDAVVGNYHIQFQDRGIYIGQLQDGQMHGEGRFEWPDGRKYRGNYKYGLKDGYGEFFFRDGKIYKGLWQAGKQNGKGTLYYPSGASETSYWEKGFRVRA